MEGCHRIPRDPRVGRLLAVLVLTSLALLAPGVLFGGTPHTIRPIGAAAAGGVAPTLYRQGLVVPAGPTPYDSLQALGPAVLLENGSYRMWYGGCDPYYNCNIILATSPDGKNWTKAGVVLPAIGGNETIVVDPGVVKVGGTYWMYYSGTDTVTDRIFAATSPDGASWTRQGLVVSNGSSGTSDYAQAFEPQVLVEGGVFRMWYSGRNATGTDRILYATSTDGLNWTKDGVALGPGPAGSLDSYGVQGGSVVHVGSSYVMVYVGLTTARTASLLYATSPNGLVWTRAGSILAGIPGNETNLFLPDLLVEASGRWDLYYDVRNGVSDLQIYLARSDVTPPVTMAKVAGTTGGGGWFRSNVSVSLNATDDLSGVASTGYSLDQGPWVTYTGAVTVSGDGTHTIRFNSTDNAGNAEPTQTSEIRIDTTPPVTAVLLSGPAGTNGWYLGPVTLRLTATDAGSGVAATEFSLTGATWVDYTAPLPFVEGISAVFVRSVDVAGNVEPAHLVVVKIDSTAPTATLTVPSRSTDSSVTVTWTAADTGSGLGRVELSVDGGTPDNVTGMTGRILALGDGTHTITLRVMDRAGNTVTSEAVIRVDSNPFSLTGPYSGAPTYLLIVLAAAIAGFLLWWRTRRKPSPPKDPPAGEPKQGP